MLKYIKKKLLYMLRCKKKKYKYDIEVVPERTIKYVEFSYCKHKHCKYKRKKYKIWLVADGKPTEKKYLCQCPCRWDLNRKVCKLKLISTKRLKRKCMNIEVVYKEECIKLKPGESLPLPSEPSPINHVTAYVFTAPGTTSIIAIGQSALFPDKAEEVGESISKFDFLSASPFPSSSKLLFNIGDSTIYVCNLTTELLS